MIYILLNAENAYPVKWEPEYRIDYIVIPESTLAKLQPPSQLAYRGDDRLPNVIFREGLKRRDKARRVKCESWIRSDGTTYYNYGNNPPEPILRRIPQTVFRDLPMQNRREQMGISEDEVVFRVYECDLAPTTCTSLTKEFRTATQFPYSLDKKKTADVYIYVIDFTKIKWMPTYRIQEGGPIPGLSKCGEITCNRVDPTHILGAFKIRRKKDGIGGRCKVDYNILGYEINPTAWNLARAKEQLNREFRTLGGLWSSDTYNQLRVIGNRDPIWNANSLLLQTLIAMKDCFELKGFGNSMQTLIDMVKRMATDAEHPYPERADEKRFFSEKEHKGERIPSFRRRSLVQKPMRAKGRPRTGSESGGDEARKRLLMQQQKKEKRKPPFGRPKSGRS